ncbi:RNA 2',3'-cyclic phosphodiesterase [Maritimibacter sp. 55A14]|uniref:RNA 2',3'-cyclic phosphodiesterase n=1 Tax=Maritimibacter sp. 55A14 TaxID=2174844 RepID=UPI000D61DC14|nr:RNA 2',3'-cyclic phosphodiesterase [Maritimibacter sp. 55A14]PWE32058.1 RNA 2',3'-cyclic phosphodiesterase [Maritimibacter sp. 55A14]
MIRAFVAIALPEEVLDRLAAVQSELPLARVAARETLHLTLAFLGQVPEPDLEDAHRAFSEIEAPEFDLRLSGVGVFGADPPRSIHAGLAESAALRQLQGKVMRAARAAGLRPPARKFVPHVTLARPRPAEIDPPRLEKALADLMGLDGPAFAVHDFRLYRSDLSKSGAHHAELARYPLAG